jgi:hypothetical protein
VLADTHDDQASENPAQRTKTVASDLLQQVGGMFDTETDASIAAMVDDCADNISGSSSDDDEAPMSNFIVRVNPYIYHAKHNIVAFMKQNIVAVQLRAYNKYDNVQVTQASVDCIRPVSSQSAYSIPTYSITASHITASHITASCILHHRIPHHHITASLHTASLHTASPHHRIPHHHILHHHILHHCNTLYSIIRYIYIYLYSILRILCVLC